MVTCGIADTAIQWSLDVISGNIILSKLDSQLLKYCAVLVSSCDFMPSLGILYVIYFVERIFTLGLLLSAIAQNVFFPSIAILINNIIFNYCQRMRRLSEILSENFEQNKNIENKEICHYIENDLKIFIEEYKTFTT